MATYGYVRVSTVKQVDEGESLDVQQRTIAGYALMHGMKIDKTFIERGVSGSKPLADRPQGAALLAAIKPGADGDSQPDTVPDLSLIASTHASEVMALIIRAQRAEWAE